MIKALIFDLDGTVADTAPAVWEAINLVLAEKKLPPISFSDMMKFFNGPATFYPRFYLPEEERNSEEKIADANRLMDEKYALTYLHTDKTFHGVPEMLEELKKHFHIAMLSNKQNDFVHALNRQLFREGLFELAYGVRAGYPPKPDPTVPRQMAAEMGLVPSECAFIGDTNYDVETAKNAGMLAVDICWGYMSEEGLLKAGADYVAKSPQELIDVLMKLK